MRQSRAMERREAGAEHCRDAVGLGLRTHLQPRVLPVSPSSASKSRPLRVVDYSTPTPGALSFIPAPSSARALRHPTQWSTSPRLPRSGARRARPAVAAEATSPSPSPRPPAAAAAAAAAAPGPHTQQQKQKQRRRRRRALADGTWFKMICGASSQDLPRIRNLAMLYALLGVDCVDAAADPAVVAAVRAGFDAARAVTEASLASAVVAAEEMTASGPTAGQPPFPWESPWVMVSVNDDEDPHFRKATFHAPDCPPSCPRPCEAVCPADAINAAGILHDICYGCGRCVPVCPQGIVSTVPFVHTPDSILTLIQDVDAIEIHTQSAHGRDFERLWSQVGATVCSHLKLLAVSFPDPGTQKELSAMLRSMWSVISSIPDDVELVWQTDGRPMSGDIGRGTAKAAVSLAGVVKQVLLTEGIPGHVQPAGGTNDATAPLLAEAGLLHTPNGVAGIAVGGYARKIVGPTLDQLAARGVTNLENDEELLNSALHIARPLIQAIKQRRQA